MDRPAMTDGVFKLNILGWGVHLVLTDNPAHEGAGTALILTNHYDKDTYNECFGELAEFFARVTGHSVEKVES